jgi:voltage-gated potassium channel Kch
VESSERKLIRAGANEVVSPYKASGRTMASLALIERGDESASAHMRDGGAVTSRRSAAPT